MSNNRLRALVATFFIGGILAGCIISDAATLNGFPYGLHRVELKLDSSKLGLYTCMRLGALFGEDISDFDLRTNELTDCVIQARGTSMADGSFRGYFGGTTWLGRVRGENFQITIPAKNIISVGR